MPQCMRGRVGRKSERRLRRRHGIAHGVGIQWTPVTRMNGFRVETEGSCTLQPGAFLDFLRSISVHGNEVPLTLRHLSRSGLPVGGLGWTMSSPGPARPGLMPQRSALCPTPKAQPPRVAIMRDFPCPAPAPFRVLNCHAMLPDHCGWSDENGLARVERLIGHFAAALSFANRDFACRRSS